MDTDLKSCSVLLNRNFDVSETTFKINYFPTVEMKKFGKAPSRSEISDSKKAPQEVNEERNKKLRKKERVNYSDDINTEKESSCSDYTDDSSSSDDEETTQERKKMKYSLSISNPKKMKCLLCDQSFSSHSAYVIHKRSHASRPFKCILCIKKFEHRQAFITHMKNNHPEIKPFICEHPRCDKSFKTQKQREIHHKMHWKYMCKYCKKLFLRKHHMRKHVMEIH